MRSGGLLLRVLPALRPAIARVLVAGLALALVAPAPAVLARPAAPVADPETGSPPAAHLPPPPGKTSLVSTARGGGPGNGASAESSISANGRFVAFTSAAGNLVRGDTNGAFDVFVLDRNNGRITRAPLPGGRPVPNSGRASEPSISGNGRIVAFTYTPPSAATAVVGPIVLAWDRQTGETEFVSRTEKGPAAQGSRQPSVSADGRYVAYTSSHPSIVEEDETDDDVFRYDRRTQRTVIVSVNPDGRPISGFAFEPSISGDGNLVAFASDGGDSVVDEDTGNGLQVYVRDIAAGITERVTKPPGGGQANGVGRDPAISANGRYVAFQSSATNLATGPGSGAGGLFRRDLRSDTTILVSLTPNGNAADGTSGQPSITEDGNFIAFTSTASNLLSPTAATARLVALVRGRSEVYIRDVAAGETVLVSVARNGDLGGALSASPAVGGSGRYIAFASTSSALIPKDGNEAADVFLRDLPPAPRVNPAELNLGGRAVGTESLPSAAILSNTGWSPLSVTGSSIAGADRREFRIVSDGCRDRVLRRAESCTVSVVFKPTAKGKRNATLEIADAFTGSPRTVRLVGSASQAKLELDPPIGQPGVVVIVNGSGFPAGAQVRLSWSIGITPHLRTVVADARGRFRVPVIVFHNDHVGPRELIAEPATGADFPPASAEMLVSQPSMNPPSFAILRLIDLPLVLMIRG